MLQGWLNGGHNPRHPLAFKNVTSYGKIGRHGQPHNWQAWSTKHVFKLPIWNPIGPWHPQNPLDPNTTKTPDTPQHPLSPTPLTHTPSPSPQTGRVLCAVLVTIPWAWPPSLIEFHSIGNDEIYPQMTTVARTTENSQLDGLTLA